MVRIDEQEGGAFGHFPFQMLSINQDGTLEVGVLLLGGDVISCYRAVKKNVKKGASKVFLSVDFPAKEGIDNDFVAVFSVEDGASSLFAIPYDTVTGEKLPIVEGNEVLGKIREQFDNVVFA